MLKLFSYVASLLSSSSTQVENLEEGWVQVDSRTLLDLPASHLLKVISFLGVKETTALSLTRNSVQQTLQKTHWQKKINLYFKYLPEQFPKDYEDDPKGLFVRERDRRYVIERQIDHIPISKAQWCNLLCGKTKWLNNVHDEELQSIYHSLLNAYGHHDTFPQLIEDQNEKALPAAFIIAGVIGDHYVLRFFLTHPSVNIERDCVQDALRSVIKYGKLLPMFTILEYQRTMKDALDFAVVTSLRYKQFHLFYALLENFVNQVSNATYGIAFGMAVEQNNVLAVRSLLNVTRIRNYYKEQAAFTAINKDFSGVLSLIALNAGHEFCLETMQTIQNYAFVKGLTAVVEHLVEPIKVAEKQHYQIMLHEFTKLKIRPRITFEYDRQDKMEGVEKDTKGERRIRRMRRHSYG